eukprot:2972203-Pleurochrysis_carterae.AAC.1
MSQTAGKTYPRLSAIQAESSSKSAASENLELFGFSSPREHTCVRDECEGATGLPRMITFVFGVLASKISASMKRRVGRDGRGVIDGGSRRRSACVR